MKHIVNVVNVVNVVNEIKSYISEKEMTKEQLEATVNWLLLITKKHLDGVEPLDEETFAEVGSLFDGLSCDLFYLHG